VTAYNDAPWSEQLKMAKQLTAREAQCLLWAAIGKSSKQIASELQIAPDTVNDHIASATRKLGARTRPEAVIKLICERARRSASDGA
jgi:DNA-binding CsgD family transcriptional regulator